MLDRTSAALALAISANRGHHASIWLGEGATASGGGIHNASGTYSATFIWLNKLGDIGRFGGDGLMRQSLWGGSYALLDPVRDFRPRPCAWVALLWKQLVGGADRVLSVAGDEASNRTLRVFSRCGSKAGEIVVFGLTLSKRAESMTLGASLSGAQSREDFVLTGKLGGSEISLNGKTMAMVGGEVPRFAGAHAAVHAPLALPPYSSFFVRLASKEWSAVCKTDDVSAAAALPSVVVGGIRVQALSSTVLRIERKGPQGWLDQPTFTVVNRDFVGDPVVLGSPVVDKATGAFNVSVNAFPDAYMLSVSPKLLLAEKHFTVKNTGLFPAKAAALAVHAATEAKCGAACDAVENCTSWLFHAPSRVREPHIPTRKSTCTGTTSNTDVGGPQSLPPKPGNSQCNATVSTCCAWCDKDEACSSFVLAPPSSWSKCSHMPYCFLLKGYKSTHTKKGSVLGTKGKAPPPGPPKPPPPPPGEKPNCALNHGYGELTLSSGSTFGCPLRGCDSAWSGRWQGGDLGQNFRQPALTLHATVYSADGATRLGSSDDATAPFHFPSASALPGVFALRDSPRFRVPPGGAIPQTNVAPELANTSGYDIRNDADDVYLIIVKDNNFTGLKHDFLTLTGPVPRLPDYALGIWFTEWSNYTSARVMDEISRWTADKLPLSIFGLDINWRFNSFGGNHCTKALPGQTCEYYYNETNTTRIPNMSALIGFEHAQGLRMYLNDHPKGFAPETSPFEIKFRYDGLMSKMNKRLDYWWYGECTACLRSSSLFSSDCTCADAALKRQTPTGTLESRLLST